MEFNVDLSEALDRSPVADAVYEVVCEKEPEAAESESGNPCAQWLFVIADIVGQEETAGKYLPKKTPLVGKGSGFTEEILEAFGIPFQAFGEGKERQLKFMSEDCVGKRALAKVSTTVYKGKPQNQIDSFMPLPS